MEPKKIKRLVLSKETISSLDHQEQNNIRGGTSVVNTNQTCSQKCSIWCASDFCDSDVCGGDDRTDYCTDGWYC